MLSHDLLLQVRFAVKQAFAPVAEISKPSDTGSKGVYGSHCPLPPWQFELTHIYQLICQDPQASLLHYLYSDNPSWHFEADAVKLIWQQFSSEHLIKRNKVRQFSGLCYLAMQDHKHQIIHGKPAHTISRIIEISGVSVSNWRRDWLPLWRILNDVVSKLDAEALSRVSLGFRDYNYDD